MTELLITALLGAVVAIVFFRRKKERAGTRCWQCGEPIDGAPYLCPHCGETLHEEEDDDSDPDSDEYDDDDDKHDRYSFPANRK